MLRTVFLASLVVALVGCTEDSLLPGEVAGTYTLQTINGEPLPWQIGNTAGKIQDVTAGSVVLRADSSCSISLTIQTAEFDVFGELGSPTTTTETDPCTFVLERGGLTLTFPTGDPDTGSVAGSQVTILRNDNVFVFGK